MTGNPADIGHASEPVLGVDIEDVLDGQGSSKKITSSGVNNTLRFSSGARGLKKSKFTVRYSCWISERFGYSHKG